jgi:hypothetical protein
MNVCIKKNNNLTDMKCVLEYLGECLQFGMCDHIPVFPNSNQVYNKFQGLTVPNLLFYSWILWKWLAKKIDD